MGFGYKKDCITWKQTHSISINRPPARSSAFFRTQNTLNDTLYCFNPSLLLFFFSFFLVLLFHWHCLSHKIQCSQFENEIVSHTFMPLISPKQFSLLFICKMSFKQVRFWCRGFLWVSLCYHVNVTQKFFFQIYYNLLWIFGKLL